MSSCETLDRPSVRSLVSKRQAARMACVSRRSIEQALTEGRLTTRVIAGRTWITAGSARAFAAWVGDGELPA